MEHDVSVFKTDEQEQIRFSAATLLNEITIDPVTFEETRTELGHFSQAEQADNRVRVTTWTGRGRYQVYTGRHVTEAGWSLRRLRFDDRLFEREDVSELSNIPDTLYLARLDSLIELGYFERPDTLIATQYQGTANLHTSQAGGYLQSSFDLLSQRDRLVVTLGVRADYFSFNGEWTVSPRASARFRLAERTTLTGSWGLYHQAPTYRELRGEPQPGHPLPASLNRRLHAQRSVQYVAGIEHFTRRRRLTWRAEVYYKQLARLISYDLNNVRTSYSGNNDSEGYTYGLDVQVRGEFVPGLESWVSYSYLVARERFLPAFQTPDNQGWLPRPTDQRHTYTLFIEDYLPGRPTWKLNMRLLFGSGFAYTKPSLVQEADGSIGLAPGLRNARRSPWFLRTDIGAAKRFTLSFGKQKAVLELAAELLNTFDTVTAIDFLWVPRSDGSLLSLPLRTTPRTFNLRARVDF